MIPRFLGSCDLTTCPTGCCRNDNSCAPEEECKRFEAGQACFQDQNCESNCCVDKICQGGSNCRAKELGMLSFFAVFILSSIIIIIGLYFHARRKRRQAQTTRRFRAPRIRQIIAEGQIIEDKKPPILTVGVIDTTGVLDISDSKADLNNPYLKKPDPTKSSIEEFEKVVWRSRANSRMTIPVQQEQEQKRKRKETIPQELNNFDPYLETKSSPLRKPLDEAKEVPLEEVTISNELANQILGGMDLDEDYQN